MADTSVTKAKDGRGGFFAVDRRAWHLVSGLGLNQAIAYLRLASSLLILMGTDLASGCVGSAT